MAATETMCRIRCEVVRVDNQQASCQRTGDLFIFGDRTPQDMCAKAFQAVYPVAIALQEGGTIKENGETVDYVDITCPDGHVTYRLSRF